MQLVDRGAASLIPSLESATVWDYFTAYFMAYLYTMSYKSLFYPSDVF